MEFADLTKQIRASVARHVAQSRREVTVLFTDIEGSTQLWDEQGDVAGRLTIDLHNRLLFPAIRKFRGKVIKTIGDSIMASFDKPAHALAAAIAMQQILARRRRREGDLDIQIRVGMHTGTALVEGVDVFGDVVNVAARVESEASGGEILVSEATARALGEGQSEFRLTHRQFFVPKGKKERMEVFTCAWKRHPDLVADIKSTTFIPVVRRQKAELLLYVAACAILVWVLMSQYLFFVVADFEFVAIQLAHPHPAWLVLAAVAVAGAAFGLIKKRHALPTSLPPVVFRLLKGGGGFALVFLAVFSLARGADVDLGRYWSGALWESRHIFVEVLDDNLLVYRAPSTRSAVVLEAKTGTFFLQTDLVERDNITWTKVLLGREGHRFGYLRRWLPASAGVAFRRLTWADKFAFRYFDLYGLLLGALGFWWGFRTFKIRPM